MVVNGVQHFKGEACEFINLKIHNVPGIGIGSWKYTGATLIEDCIIFNNGYIGRQRGHGVGIYIQNAGDKLRIAKGNLIFNNYYKGIQVWDAINKPQFKYVKNVRLEENVVFNNGFGENKNRINW